MKIRVGNLKRLIREAMPALGTDIASLDEAEATGSEGSDSLDAQVDRYLGQYESEAKTAKQEGLDFRSMTRSFLSEADDELPDVAGSDAAPKLALDSIDIESFANSIARLIENYDSLLEVRNTLLRRAKSFLDKSYAPDVVQAYDKTMREQHGLEDGKSSEDVADDEFPAPGADRAGADAGSGAGPA